MANVNFVLLKINGIDMGQLPLHQQMTALNALYNEETENIVLELKRKSCWRANENIVDYSDIEIGKRLCLLTIQHNSPILTNAVVSNSTTERMLSDIIVNMHLPASRLEQYCMAKSTQTEDITFYVHERLHNLQKNTEGLVEHEHNLFEESLSPEIDIEEITLRKSDSTERLGITVCYSNAEDYASGGSKSICGEVFGETLVTEVFISDIHPDSVAGRDGRLRQGDQILQINGKDIKTRPETETLIAENNNAVTLLISRYLFADEDDFNDPSTNEDEDELLVVEDDEDDEDYDDFYDENNMTYVNCLINNDCCNNATGELDKAIMSQITPQEHLHPSGEKLKEKFNFNAVTSTTRSNPTHPNNSLKSNSDCLKEKVSRNEKRISTKSAKNVRSNSSRLDAPSNVKSNVEYETEHIYETIPEDAESEPFYCSPYDSSVYVTAMTPGSSTISDALQHLQQKQRVAQWLGIKHSHEICSTTTPRQYMRGNNGRSTAFHNKSSTDTIRSAFTSLTKESTDCLDTNIALNANCQLEDQDNSSSAYNTGGSNNSVSPLTLMLNPKNRTDQHDSQPISMINSPINGLSDDDFAIMQNPQKTPVQLKIHSPKEKLKITSPKNGTFQQSMITHKAGVKEVHSQSNVVEKHTTIFKDHRNILQKQNFFSQKLSMEKPFQIQPHLQNVQYYFQQQPDQLQCPQFTAPNLSQYHFVSSQEVNNLSLNNKMPKSSSTVPTTIAKNTRKDDDAMVWKVKRRPDGTRYIVRRPAKNRLIKDRNTRLNVERLRNDITTTEDDTISEIKTGRYWTREERKKHIEKAKERRQHQQHLYQQQHKMNLTYEESTTAALCINEMTNRILHDSSEGGIVKSQPHLNFKNQQQMKLAHEQQHFQLQFNSNDNHKHPSPLYKIESPTKTCLPTLPTTAEELKSAKINVDKLNITVFNAAEQNEISNSI